MDQAKPIFFPRDKNNSPSKPQLTMDILRLLSRSTKHANKSSSSKNNPSGTLPSAGIAANPQLYHDAIPESRGKKRKRGTGNDVEDVHTKEEDSIDFFATKSAAPNPRKGVPEDASKRPAGKQDDVQLRSKLMEEGECRQILKSHRLKVTLLPSQKLLEKKVKKSKKPKSSKTAVRNEFTQIFPQPLVAFGDLRTIYGISGRMAENLERQGYKLPTEVQMGSLPMLLQPEQALGESTTELGSVGETHIDLLAVAPTGSGKTLAFLIPVVNQIIQRRRKAKDSHNLEAIVIAPTKELASQIVNEAKKLCLGTGVKVVGMKKGLKIISTGPSDEQDSSSSEEDEDTETEGNALAKSAQPVSKADILVTTPGLLLSALSNGTSEGYASLPTVQTLVLDEADVLLDPLFRDQTLGIWNACTSTDLRITLWSATMGSNIESLASSTIYDRRARLGINDPSRLVRLVVGLKDSAIPNITHRLTYAANEPGKLIALRQLLHPTAKSTDATQSLRPPFLVFTQTIPRAIALHSELLYDIPAEAGGSSRIAVLHSDLSDSVRESVMARFRNGEIWILITTDILSRGVDFRGVNGVVNYDVPNSGAAYIHRVGRTGRAGRDGGVAVTFYTKEDIPYVKNIANIIAASEKQAGKPASEASMQKWFLDALPTPSKEEKKKLKLHGVEARRGGPKEAKNGKGRVQISTKSGYERKVENNRKGAIQGSRRRALEGQRNDGGGELVVEDSD
jgi:ATP-dependent RNA helicase DDX52/ROK1